MSNYSLTKSRTFQYIVIILILAIIGGGIYKYFQAKAAKINMSQNFNTNGLVGHWTFDGKDMTSTTVIDSSGNGITGSLFATTGGIPIPVAGKIGQALHFDASPIQGNGVNLGTSAALARGTAITLAVWVKNTASYPNDGHFIQRGGVYGGDTIYKMGTYNGSGNLFFGVGNASNINTITSATNLFPLNKWVFVVGTLDTDNVMKLYLNGAVVASGTNIYAPGETAGDITIFGSGSFSGNKGFLGDLDDVRIYNRALSENEIIDLYQVGEANVNTGALLPQGIGNLNSGLAGYWKLDDGSGTNASDSSTNANNGTLSGTTLPTWTTGRINGGLNFTNSLNHVHVPHSSSINLSKNITFAAWVNVSSYGTQIWAGKSSTCYNSSQVGWDILATSAPNLNLRLCGSGINFSKLFTLPIVGTWTHIAFTYDGSNVITYTNGVPSAPAAFTGNLTAVSNHFAFGAADGGAFPLDGSMDEVRLYSRALSADEVTKLYQLTTPTGVDTSLKGYWSFDGNTTKWTSPTAGTVTDLSGAGNTGTLTNMTRATSPVSGKIGQALQFVSSGSQHVQATATTSYTGTILTVSLWFKRADALGTEQALYYADIGYQLNSSRLHIIDYSGGKLSGTTLASNASFTDLKWHHAVFMADGTNLKIYVDGVLDVSRAETILSTNSKNSGWIGSSNSRYFNGSIDDVRVYNRALSDNEVTDLYKMGGVNMNTSAGQPQGIGNLDSGLAGYWKFDEGSGGTTADSSTNANTGTLISAPTWSTGRIVGGMNFNGTSDYVRLANPIFANQTDKNYTLSAWFKTTSNGAFEYIYSVKSSGYSGTHTRLGVNLFLKSGTVCTSVWYASSRDICSTDTFNDGNWHHAVIVRQLDGTFFVYVDGIFKQTGIWTDSSYTLNRASIGAKYDGSLDSFFNGSIDEVRVYNRPLSADEIAKLYQTTTPTGVDTSLKGYWSFDGNATNWTSSSAGTVADLSGNGNTGTLTNMTKAASPAVGKIGQALSFANTTNTYVSVANNSDLDIDNTESLSVSAWFRSNGIDTVNKRSLFGKNGGNVGYGCFQEQNTQYIVCRVRRPDSSFMEGSTPNITFNKWYHLVYVIDGTGAGTGTIYLNGTPNTPFSLSDYDPSNAGGFGIGAGGPISGLSWPGLIDEVRVYNRALSASEIASLYNSGGGTFWTCGTGTISDPDGNVYNTVQIGTQCWQRQNMMTTKYPSGSSITRGPTGATWDTTDHAYYAYPPNVGNTAEETLANIQANKSGFVYQWSAAMNGSTTVGAQGICPTGWHIPTHDEYTTLERSICTSATCATDFPYNTSTATWVGTDEGAKLSTATLNGTNSFGFNANLVGYRNNDGSFTSRNSHTNIWSSLQSGGSAWYRRLYSGYSSISRTYDYKAAGFSVRCLKN